MGKTTIVLVEDHEVVREGLRALIRTEADMEVVGEAHDGREAVALVRQLCPDVVLMDISLPGQNGFQATLQIKRASKATRVLVLSSYDDLECVEQLLEAGATGFLSKRSAAIQLAEAIRAVRSGRTFYSPEVEKRMKDFKLAALRAGRGANEPAELTGREKEVLEFIARGLRNKEIAVEMGISIKTVEKHRQGAMNKLNIHDTAGLTRYALRSGIVAPGAAPKPVGI
ncbi:MAG TPA: response regulator transcription factor [Verrucomicrobiae bacterium]|nr:response regulator transcription factor [Verrucomicrobiae bacterium]